MREYELFYLVGESKESELPTVRTEIEKLCTAEGASFLPAETSDKRKLAYAIKGETRGTYIARRFTLPDHGELAFAEFDVAMAAGDPIARLTKQLSLLPTVLRVLILRADTLPPLKAIERTEYVRKETRPRAARPAPAAPAPMTTPTEAEKQVTTTEIDKQLDEVLNI